MVQRKWLNSLQQNYKLSKVFKNIVYDSTNARERTRSNDKLEPIGGIFSF